MIKALIVDDEYPARMELRFQLSTFADVEVIGEATNAREALRLIGALDYDVIFLDVQMPGMNGVELARQVKGQASPPKVVFVTAYEHYAVPAFAMRAVDYLLKPIEPERLSDTIGRLRELQGAAVRPEQPDLEKTEPAKAEPGKAEPGKAEPGKTEPAVEQRAPAPLTFLLADKAEKQMPLPLGEVVYIYSEGYNVFVKTHHDTLTVRHTLQELTDRLPPEQFFRSHRSYLVNIFQVKEISPYFNGAYLLKMKDKEHSEVIVSRSNVKRMKELFSMG